MNTVEKLEKFLTSKENHGKTLPNIRFFDGINAYCTTDGQYKADSLDESLSLFLNDNQRN
jgi:hypothetical protein